MGERTHIEADMFETAKNLRESGMTIRRISSIMDISSDELRQMFKKNNYQYSRRASLYEQQIKEQLKKGKSVRQISSELGVCKNDIYVHFRSIGEPIKLKRKTSYNVLESIELSKEGEKTRQLADRYGVTIKTITRNFREYGYSLRDWKRTVRDRKIIMMYRDGCKVHDIAKEMRVSERAIYKVTGRYKKSGIQ